MNYLGTLSKHESMEKGEDLHTQGTLTRRARSCAKDSVSCKISFALDKSMKKGFVFCKTPKGTLKEKGAYDGYNNKMPFAFITGRHFCRSYDSK